MQEIVPGIKIMGIFRHVVLTHMILIYIRIIFPRSTIKGITLAPGRLAHFATHVVYPQDLDRF